MTAKDEPNIAHKGTDMQLAETGDSRWQGALMGISSGDAGCLARNYVK